MRVKAPPLQGCLKEEVRYFSGRNLTVKSNVVKMPIDSARTMRGRFYMAIVFASALMCSVFPSWAQHLVDEGTTGTDAQQNTASQAQATREAGDKMEFAVASVRPSTQDAGRKGYDFLNPYSTLQPPKGGLFSANSQLLGFIIFAYNIRDASQYSSLAQQLPKWAQSGWFDIEARAEGNPNRDQMRLMMQSLLEKRFGLVLRTEVRQGNVLALELNGQGPGLHPHSEDPPCVDRPESSSEGRQEASPIVYCGIDVSRLQGRLHVAMVDVSMDQVARFLGGIAGNLGARENLPVLDRTGLRGKFDATLDFVPDKEGPEDATSDASGPTFTKALGSQLGLKLSKQSGPIAAFVIDHVEEPFEN